jgi:glycosyltransferase involved in cell wall biosynthesis
LKKAIVSVINDLTTDQRVHKHCLLLQRKGYDVTLIGRHTSVSRPLDDRPYATVRMRLPFERGPLFYASYNIGLFVQLLFRKADLLFSNDLDTLLPNYLVSRVKRVPLIYDSHEYFTEVPELAGRPAVQRVWQRLENWLLPKLKYTVTVNRSIAQLYRQRFDIDMVVLRNIPESKPVASRPSKAELGLPVEGKLVILQGSGINMHRGAEEAVLAMQYVDGVTLLILGSGDVVATLKQMVIEHGLSGKVLFRDRMPYAEMMAHTRLADLGLTLDRDTNINYRYSLPNKLFDYIHAGIPVLASDLVEVDRIVKQYGIGDSIQELTPENLANKITEMLHSEKYVEWKANCAKATAELNWETESKELAEIIDRIHG